MFDADVGPENQIGCDVGIKHTPRLWNRKSIQQVDWRNDGEQIQHGRISNYELLLIHSVITNGLQDRVFINAVIKDSQAASDYGVGWRRTCGGLGRRRAGDLRRPG